MCPKKFQKNPEFSQILELAENFEGARKIHFLTILHVLFILGLVFNERLIQSKII